ncbi:MAG: hypothetical protein AB1646_17625 [Thermodesulfobacteriota bacterium]
MATTTRSVGMFGTGNAGSALTTGDNPWSEVTRSLQERLSKVWQTMEAQGSGPFGGSTSPTVVRPEDSDVQGYLAHLMGAQRNTMDDYVAQAAGAGIKRGGLNVVGGPSMESSLHHAAMKDLAQGYGDLLKESMDYAKYARTTEANQQGEDLNNLLNLMRLQHQYISSEADWNSELTKAQAAARAATAASSSQSTQGGGSTGASHYDPLSETEMARWRNAMEIQRLNRQNLEDEAKANRWARVAATHPFPEYLLSEKAMIEQGIVSPWSRSLSIGKGGGGGKSSSSKDKDDDAKSKKLTVPKPISEYGWGDSLAFPD